MTPHDALELLYNVCKQMRLTAEDHAKLANAAAVIKMALPPSPVVEPAKEEKE